MQRVPSSPVSVLLDKWRAGDREALPALIPLVYADLRKLARECWAKLKVDSLVVKLLLNHKLTDLEATYFQSRGEEIKRDALELWHGWLDSQGFDLLQGETVVRQPVRRASVDPAGWLR